MKKRQSITLLEIMIVIFLIGLIGGVVGYNMKGSLDRGRAFKTQQMQEKIAEILELEMNVQGLQPLQVVTDKKNILAKSGFFKDNQELLKDGWGQEMDVKWNATDLKFDVISKTYDQYQKKHQTVAKK